ncbi:uncharacterized protein LOC117172871 [Belonocnema kinseyi]|uniref:uncharacterized protein LOC117172871 n=1 Tax=Belonocnema kinseyi TaxID=2817044 RepID=UPI00143D0593|nr:uncharacterized protein LOC117172871 [Belonocnema kinseyi]
MIDYVIEIQGFRILDNNFIPNEVAIVTQDHKFFALWIAAPPHPFCDLSTCIKQQNYWLSIFYHGIEWFEGDIFMKFLYFNLRDVAKSSATIYTHGRKKAKLLQKIIIRQIINLEELTCPTFKKLSDKRKYCFHHGIKFDNTSRTRIIMDGEDKKLVPLIPTFSSIEHSYEDVWTDNKQPRNSASASADGGPHNRCVGG